MSAPAKPDPLGVACPYCGASPQERCSTNPNRIRDWRWCKPHAARLRAAEKARKEKG